MTAKRMVWQFIEARDHQVMRQVHRWRAPRWLRIWMICVHAAGRRLDLVFGGDCPAALRRRYAVYRFCRQRLGGGRRGRAVPPHEKCQQAEAPLPARSALLGERPSARPVFFSLRPRDERVRDRDSAVHFLSGIAGAPLALSVSIAVSRVILGMHFVSDVVVGSLLGAGLGYGSYLLFR